MSILDIFTEDPSERIRYAMQRQSEQEELSHLRSEVADLQEDLLKISDAFDGVGWAPLPSDEAKELPLKTVKKVAEIARAMNAVNPFVKRGVNARISYIWGKGVTFDGIDDIQENVNLNRKKLFSPQAYEEFERVLATDGNAFLALPVENEANSTDEVTAFRIGLDEITGAIANPLDREEIWYYKREYSVMTTNATTGEENPSKSITKYYPSVQYYQRLQRTGKNLPRRWGKFGVEQNFVIQHTTVNKQVGWRWGVPDIMPVIFWAKAYKEYLEDNALLVKAYSRLAWEYRASSAGGAAAASAQVMAPPSRDPITGEPRNVGGTAIYGNGSGQLSALPATGSQVDFSKGSPLASAIASGLEVSLVVITSDPGSGNRATAETLDLPTLKAMESRQQIHTERFLELFEFWGVDITPDNKNVGTQARPKKRDLQEAEVAPQNEKAESSAGPDHAVVTWPQIESDTTKDRMTALGTGVELGILYKEEARKEAIDMLGIAPMKPWDELPKPEDDPAKQYEQQQAELGFQREQEAAKVVAAQGVSGGVAAKGGAQTSANSARDNRNKDRNNS